MSSLRNLLRALAIAAALVAPQAMADDIDVFLGTSGGGGNAPNVMLLIDNGPNWSRVAQGWTDPTTGASITQGEAELAAMSSALGQLVAQFKTQGRPLNVGLSMLTPYNVGTSTGGGYIRYGVRDLTVGNNLTALQTLLSNIAQCVNPSTGCGGSANESLAGLTQKDETAAFYELYKYFSGLTPYTGVPNPVFSIPVNQWDDMAGNLATDASGRALTTASAGLTAGWAVVAATGGGYVYQSPLNTAAPCAANYIIYIANNSQGKIGPFENVYEPSVIPALNALPGTGAGDTWLDEWTKYLLNVGAATPAGNNNGAIKTYILDAYNKQNNAGYSTSLQAAALQGGGLYAQVGSETAVQSKLLEIFEQISALNSTFASASLPVNATNRAQNRNQVYIPMFRPDQGLQARWFGNLKQYQLINYGGQIVLGDFRPTPQPAINSLTGFPTDCAISYWTSDDATDPKYPNGYWNFGASINIATGNTTSLQENTAAKGYCVGSSPFADLPDGSIVEKGGVGETVRKGNNPATTTSTPTWLPSGRNVITADASNNVVPFDVTHTGLPVSLVNWVLGQDVQDENGNGNLTESRPSLHGDEIHSRPLPIDYGSGNVRTFYGSNDGTLRAVDGATGQELWAFVPPEFYTPPPTAYIPATLILPATVPTGLQRLMWSNMQDSKGNWISPSVAYYGTPPGVTPTPQPKDYYMDGSIGIYEAALNPTTGAPTAVWIYPTMRRGGRMVYALDVTSPTYTTTSPSILWKFGCPHLTDDIGCSGGGGTAVTNIGQTWAMPAVAASVSGYSSPVVFIAAGYDGCEDSNVASPATTNNTATNKTYCPATQKGAGVFVLDAKTGTQLAFLTVTGMRSVAADVALISASGSGVVDHAYAVDTGGSVYRIDLGGTSPSQWQIKQVAYTSGAGRKFLFAPALLAAPGGQVYVALGSGDREHPLLAQYPYSSVVNRFYVFKDNLSVTGALNLDDTTQMYDYTNGPVGSTTGTTCSTPGVLPSSTMRGWFMNLNQNGKGEQTVTSSIIAAGMVAFSTNRPVAGSAASCSTQLGVAAGYWVNLFNGSGGISPTGLACGGLRDSTFVGGGLPPSPVLASVPVNGQIVEAVIGAAQINGGTSCGLCAQQVKPSIIPTRKPIFWKSSGDN